MCIIFQLIGLPFAVIGGTINLAHEGIGLAVDSVAKKRKERKALRRPSKRQQERLPTTADAPTKECPRCPQYKQEEEIANVDEKEKDDPPPSYTAIAAQVLLHSCVG